MIDRMTNEQMDAIFHALTVAIFGLVGGCLTIIIAAEAARKAGWL